MFVDSRDVTSVQIYNKVWIDQSIPYNIVIVPRYDGYGSYYIQIPYGTYADRRIFANNDVNYI